MPASGQVGRQILTDLLRMLCWHSLGLWYLLAIRLNRPVARGKTAGAVVSSALVQQLAWAQQEQVLALRLEQKQPQA